ncbi:MAG: leucine-rich repeat domain-containing protein [Alphaproteobacteria bacterium]|nr:leucine-rich repeat domain-containing protein [Alphaproteobacteria bacterium]
MKKSTFIFNLLATTAMATGAKAAVISGDGWSFDEETGLLKFEAAAANEYGLIDGCGGDLYNHDGFSSYDVQRIEFGEGVKMVSNFNNDYSYSNIESVSFPSSLETVSSGAFQGTSLSEVTFQNGTSDLEIGTSAFLFTYTLTSLELPDNIKKIGADAFWQSGVTSLTIPDNVEIEDNAFTSSGVTTVVLGYNTTFDQYSPFDTMTYDYDGQYIQTTVYCPDEACKNGLQDIGYKGIIADYTKDSDGVYTSGGIMYASAEDMLQGSEKSCGTHDECVALIASLGGGTGGTSEQAVPKRIYTVEEARQAVEAAGTDTVNFRIRYK